MDNNDNTVNINSPLYKDTVGTEWETEAQIRETTSTTKKPSRVRAKVLSRIRKKIKGE